MGRAVYRNERPDLAIKHTGGANLGNCYNAMYFTVTSQRQLSKDKLLGLRDLGLLGYGQEFEVKSQCDGKEEPAGFDYVKCIDEDTGKEAINYVTEKPFVEREEPYYEYKIVRRIDSSD